VSEDDEQNALLDAALQRRDYEAKAAEAAARKAEIARQAAEEQRRKKELRKQRRDILSRKFVSSAVELFHHSIDMPRMYDGGWELDTIVKLTAKCKRIFHDDQADGAWDEDAAISWTRMQWIKRTKGIGVIFAQKLVQGLAHIVVENLCPCEMSPDAYRATFHALLATICEKPTAQSPYIRMKWRTYVNVGNIDEFRRNLYDAKQTGEVAPWITKVIENGRQEDAANKVQVIIHKHFSRVVNATTVMQRLLPAVRALNSVRRLKAARDKETYRLHGVHQRLKKIHWGNGWNALQGRYQKLHAEDLAQQATFAERMQWRDQQTQLSFVQATTHRAPARKSKTTWRKFVKESGRTAGPSIKSRRHL
jgi:hypothetical protein